MAPARNLSAILAMVSLFYIFQIDVWFPVTGATSLVFGYVMLMPALIYTFLWYHRPAALQYSFFDLLCAYGYSLSVFIPISVSNLN